MEQQPKTTMNDEPTLAEIEQERQLAQHITGAISIDRLAIQDPDRVIKIMENRMRALESIRLGAIRMTEPQDWTLNKDKEGHVIANLRKSGCEKVRKYFGISTLHVHPQEVVVKPNPEGGHTAEIWGDGHCGLTGEWIMAVRGARSSKEEFIGRGTMSDLKESARTNLENKITRILAGMSAVSTTEISLAWQGTPKRWESCYKGHGYGKSAERGEASEGSEVPNIESLATTIRAVADATKKPDEQILMAATIYEKNGKKYWAKSLDDLKYGWQIQRAMDRLLRFYPEVLKASLTQSPTADESVGAEVSQEEMPI